MTEPSDEITVTRDDAESRYEVRVGDVLAGFTEFRVNSRGYFVYEHTEIDPAFRGRGLAGTLVEDAMTDAAARGETVAPRCPVVLKYLRDNTVDGLAVDWPRDV
ncbi:GNAT family N-acetyltransferase [Planococcus sp. APC 4015]|nr:GNAT family N-acetyltransferase [Planococcus sp. APC 4015]